MRDLRVLFVCTGNTCRSPMAAELLKQKLKAQGIEGLEVLSAGTAAVPAAPASTQAAQVMAEAGLELHRHRAQQVTVDLLRSAELVLTMTRTHRSWLLAEFDVPELAEKMFVLKQYAFERVGEDEQWDISDPLDQALEEYRCTARELEAALTAALPKLKRQLERYREGALLKVAIGSDHAGYNLKEKLVEFVSKAGYEVHDVGTNSTESVDYPDFAKEIASGVASGEFDRGILICGTGIGMSMAANKVRGIRAALCHDVFSAQATREDNNANVLTMGARVIGEGLAAAVVETWLTAEFKGGRHARRVRKIMALEAGN